jgi:hypothetical protein
MKEQIKKFLNEEQDPKAIEKWLQSWNLLMKNEEIGYIAVQKNRLLLFFQIVLLWQINESLFQPKNLVSSMDL